VLARDGNGIAPVRNAIWLGSAHLGQYEPEEMELWNCGIVAAMLTDAQSLKYVELSEESRVRTTLETSAEIFRGSQAYRGADYLAVEEPLEIQLAYGPVGARRVKSISVTMRTPAHDFELAAGFLMTEGVVSDSTDITEIRYVAGSANPGEAERDRGVRMDAAVLRYKPERNIVQVKLAPDVSVSMANLARNFYTTSSCGICGKASLLALRTVCPCAL
jgi:FdhD protein